MDWDLFTKIVDEAATIPAITIYSLQGLGEPMLDRRIVDRVRYIKEKDPKAQVELFTNGVYCTPEKIDGFKDAGLDCLIVSLNAVSAEQHLRIMNLKDKFDTVCANIEYAKKVGMNVQVHTVIDKEHFNEDDARKFNERWGDYRKGGIGKVVGIGNWAGDIPVEYPEGAVDAPNKCCFRALSTIYVLYNGLVTPCCFMPTEAVTFGDLRVQSLREMYSNPQYVQFREDHDNDQADRWSFCATCSRI